MSRTRAVGAVWADVDRRTRIDVSVEYQATADGPAWVPMVFVAYRPGVVDALGTSLLLPSGQASAVAALLVEADRLCSTLPPHPAGPIGEVDK